MQELPWLALIALAAVGVAAFLLGRRAGRRESPPLPRDYYRGLDHLLNDRLDRATEAFVRLAERDGDAVEIQWALGTLFRRRGEFDRAVALHERLEREPGGLLRDRARMELALDYLSAGLMDRAERALVELMAVPAQRLAATERLLQLYEAQGDWANALRVFDDLPDELRRERAGQASQYLCELAELVLPQGDFGRVDALLRQAQKHDAQAARVAFLRARLAEAHEEWDAATRSYVDAACAAPDLMVEVSRRMQRWPADRAHVAVEALRAALRERRALGERQLDLCLREGGDRADDTHASYACSSCGMSSGQWFWRCPGCRSWSTLVLSALGSRRRARI